MPAFALKVVRWIKRDVKDLIAPAAKEKIPPELHLMELGTYEAQHQNLLQASEDFRIFFTADPQRPNAKPLSQAFLDRCSTLECPNFDLQYRNELCDTKDYIEKLRTLQTVQAAEKRSRSRAEALLHLHASMVQAAPNIRSFTPRLVCGAPVNTRAFQRMQNASEVFQDPLAAPKLAYGDALLETADPELLNNIRLCAQGTIARPRQLELEQLSGSFSHLPAKARDSLKALTEMLMHNDSNIRVNVQAAVPPELLRLSLEGSRSWNVSESTLSICLKSATMVLHAPLLDKN